MKLYNLTASTFLTWALHPKVKSRIRGIVEHHVHHLSVSKYQKLPKVHEKVLGDSGTSREKWFLSENMPTIIQDSLCVMSEENVRCLYADLVLIGRIDQLYGYNGQSILVDTKSHKKVTFADQLQLSFYAFILHTLKYKVTSVAFIRTVYSTIQYHEVEIIPPSAMEEIFSLID